MVTDTPFGFRLVVLGAAAGGGLPQWNCNCALCRASRGSEPGEGGSIQGRELEGPVLAQTQSSLAVSADGNDWVLLNCSPDIRQQIYATPILHPRDPSAHGLRDTPIRSIVLTNADVDHIAGLLILREKQAFTIHATRAVLDVLDANPIFNVLDPAFVSRSPVAFGTPFEPMPGLELELFSVPGKVALYLEGSEQAQTGDLKLDAETENTAGVRIRSTRTGVEAYYVPGCARLSDALAARLRNADLVLFDGTVWVNDEMPTIGVGAKTGARMGHMSMSGPDGSMAKLEPLGIRRKLFIHINNTNPVWDPQGPEHRQVAENGWEIARDGMEITV